MDFIPEELGRILAGTPELIRAFLVGGCVRDALLGHPIKDFDVEVHGSSYGQLTTALSRWGKTNLVGRSFGVIKLTTSGGQTYDFSIPRRDSKIAPGHKGFDIEFDPRITPEEAASRRDFTINSILYDPRKKQVLDFFGGASDLKRKILRHTSAAFVEDPLRVLRGMQFAGRFDLQAAPETVELCRTIKGAYDELAVERVWDEWGKWGERSVRPSAGLRFLLSTEWCERFPEILNLKDTPQNPQWHPEGDVFIHTCHCCDVMAQTAEWQKADSQSRVAWMLAILAHDFGKPATTRRELKEGEWRIVSPGHESAGAELAGTFLTRIHAPAAIRARVVPLVANHCFHAETITDRAIRRLAHRLEPENIEGLCLVMRADSLGRPPRPPTVPQSIKILLDRSHELQVRQSAPKPVLTGRDLIDIGFAPSPGMGKILRAAFEAQLEGAFSDLPQALEWIKQQGFHDTD